MQSNPRYGAPLQRPYPTQPNAQPPVGPQVPTQPQRYPPNHPQSQPHPMPGQSQRSMPPTQQPTQMPPHLQPPIQASSRYPTQHRPPMSAHQQSSLPAQFQTATSSHPQNPISAQPQPPMPGRPQPSMPGQSRPMMPGQPQRPMPGQPQHPMPGQPQHPMPGQPQRPMPGQPQRPMPGQPQRPMPGQPQHSMSGQPRPISTQASRPMTAQPQRPMPQRPLPSTQYASPQQNTQANGYAPPRPGYSSQMYYGQAPPPTGVQGAAPPQTQLANSGVYPPGYAGSQSRPTGGMRPAPATPVAPGYPTSTPPNGAPPDMQAQRAQEQSRMSSSMMPRPCALEKPAGTAREFHHRGMSLGGAPGTIETIPSSSADVITVDDGSARLRFMRLTTGAIGSDPSLMGKSGVPLAVVMTPFANTVAGETPVPVVDFSNKQIGGPLRCERCHGYANPGFKFMSGGSQFQCNLCLHTNQTPTEHFSPIAPATGQRMDADMRHELRCGSVDFVVGSPDYCIRPPRPACYLFAVDVSSGAVASGLSATAMMSIKSAIGAGLLPGSREGAKVAFMTYDRGLHFFDARGAEEGKAVTTQYVPDVNDPFVPIGGDALFLTPSQAVLAIDAAIESHGLGPNQKQNSDPSLASKNMSAESALGSALTAVKLAFADCGGKAFVIAGSLPSLGVSRLERRGGGAIGGGEDREIGLLREANPNYEILGCEIAEVQASVDLFLAPSSVYIDASTLSRVPRACGGRMHLFTEFDPVRDGASLHRSLCASISSPRAFEALLRVRTSPGLESRGEFVGHFGHPQRGDDIGGPMFDSSSTLALELTVTSKMSDNNSQNRGYPGSGSLFDDVCVQCAILFTDCAGRRRIRVHTAFASKTSVLQDVFKHADVDAVAAFLSKKAASAVLVRGTAFSKACEALTEKTAQTLFVYRKHCTTSSLSGQLILPEALKVLPLMMLGLTKSVAFRRPAVSMQSGDAVTVDERAAALSFLLSATPSEVAGMCYPRMWEVQAIDDAIGKPLPTPETPIVNSANGGSEKDGESMSREPIALPNTVALSAESLRDDRILLIENAMHMIVWLGSKVENSAEHDVIVQGGGGRLLIRGETAGAAALTKGISERGKRVSKVIERICSERRGLSRPQVVRRSAPGAGGEAKFVMPLLVEDRGSGTHSYVEYLRHIHKRVMDKMANDSAQNDMQTWEMLNHGY